MDEESGQVDRCWRRSILVEQLDILARLAMNLLNQTCKDCRGSKMKEIQGQSQERRGDLSVNQVL